MLGGDDPEQVTLLAAFVEAVSLPDLAHQLVLKGLQLQVIHIEPPIHRPRIEQKLMSGNGKQGAGQLPNPRLVKILQILRGQDQGGLLLPHPLQAVADVSHRCGIAEPQVQLVDGRYGISGSQQLIRQIGQDGKKQRVPQVLGNII